MAAKRVIPWSLGEVQTFLNLVGDERIQRELEGSTRNEFIYLRLAEQMAEHGYYRTSQQCREKLKKLKSDYRSIKDNNERGGSNRKSWKWFDLMESIYGNRIANKEKEGDKDPALLLNSMMDDSNLRTTLHREQGWRVFDMSHQDAFLAREQEVALRREEMDLRRQEMDVRMKEMDLRREEMESAASFNKALLGTLGQLVQALNGRHHPVDPPLD